MGLLRNLVLGHQTTKDDHIVHMRDCGHNKDGLLRPNSVMVVYVDPFGIWFQRACWIQGQSPEFLYLPAPEPLIV